MADRIPSAAEVTAMRHEVAYLKAEAVVRDKWVEVLEGRIKRMTSEPDACPGDERPCYVGGGTDDAHFRCGTSQCPHQQALRAQGGAA